MATLERIEITFVWSDGQEHHAEMYSDGQTWQQWGATNERLGQTVDLLESLARAVDEAGLDLPPAD